MKRRAALTAEACLVIIEGFRHQFDFNILSQGLRNTVNNSVTRFLFSLILYKKSYIEYELLQKSINIFYDNVFFLFVLLHLSGKKYVPYVRHCSILIRRVHTEPLSIGNCRLKSSS